MTSRNEYKLRRQIEQIVLDNGGVIFGGHVRDIVLHDSHAAAYYHHIRETGAVDRYEDTSYLPEYSGRHVISSDIDCYIIQHALERFEDDIRSENISILKLFERSDAKEYCPDMEIPRNTLKHIRYRVSNINNSLCANLHGMINGRLNQHARSLLHHEIQHLMVSIHELAELSRSVMLDVFVADCWDYHKFSPPFGPPDFECNALLMTQNGISLSGSIFPDYTPLQRNDELQRIMNDIKHMRACYVPDGITYIRIQKMQRKGWTLPTKYIQPYTEPLDPDDICILCHSTFTDVPYKIICCKALYHKECIIRLLNTEYSNKCIMCSRMCDSRHEVGILECQK